MEANKDLPERYRNSDWIQLLSELENRKWKLPHLLPLPRMFPKGAVKAGVCKDRGRWQPWLQIKLRFCK